MSLWYSGEVQRTCSQIPFDWRLHQQTDVLEISVLQRPVLSIGEGSLWALFSALSPLSCLPFLTPCCFKENVLFTPKIDFLKMEMTTQQTGRGKRDAIHLRHGLLPSMKVKARAGDKPKHHSSQGKKGKPNKRTSKASSRVVEGVIAVPQRGPDHWEGGSSLLLLCVWPWDWWGFSFVWSLTARLLNCHS